MRSFLFFATFVLLTQFISAHAQTSPPAQDMASLLQQAEALLGQGKPAEAYQLLAPFEAQQNADPRFDYLLGAALLESGKPAEAIAPFRRVLAVNPLFAAARLDLGRANFAVGNFAKGKPAMIVVPGALFYRDGEKYSQKEVADLEDLLRERGY